MSLLIIAVILLIVILLLGLVFVMYYTMPGLFSFLNDPRDPSLFDVIDSEDKHWILLTPAGSGEINPGKMGRNKLMLRTEDFWRWGYIPGINLFFLRGMADVIEDTKYLVSNIGLDCEIYSDFFTPDFQLQLRNQKQLNSDLTHLAAENESLRHDMLTKPAAKEIEKTIDLMESLSKVSTSGMMQFINPKYMSDMKKRMDEKHE